MEELKKQVAENSKRIEDFEIVSNKIVTVINGYSIDELKQGMMMIVELGRVFYVTKKYKYFWIIFLGLFVASFFGLDFEAVKDLIKLLT